MCGADDRRGYEIMLLAPRGRQSQHGNSCFGRYGGVAVRGAEALVVNIPPSHRCLSSAKPEIVGEPGAIRRLATTILARKHTTAERGKGDQTHALLSAGLGQFVLETSVDQA